MKPYKGGRAGKGKKGKKPTGRVVDAFGADEADEASKKGDGPSKESRSASKKSRKERRKERSPLGFMVAAAVAVGGIAVAVLTSVQGKRESDRILRSMRSKPLMITEHAACRMDCRFVTKKDVLESLFKGRVHRSKSDLRTKQDGCSKVVVDATLSTANGRSKNVQNVFAACRDETRLVTAIDRSTNWPCGPC